MTIYATKVGQLNSTQVYFKNGSFLVALKAKRDTLTVCLLVLKATVFK